MPKILISDAMSNVAQKIFEKNNISVDVKTGLSEDDIVKIIPEYDGMVVRSATKVTKKILDAAKNLKVIGRAGAEAAGWATSRPGGAALCSPLAVFCPHFWLSQRCAFGVVFCCFVLACLPLKLAFVL